MRSGGGGVPGVWTDLGTLGGNTSTDPNAPDLPPKPRDYASKQGAQMANALRKQNWDFLLAGNRQPNVGIDFNPTAATGFQIESNKASIPSNITKGTTTVKSLNPTLMSWADILAGKIPPTIKQVPGNPLFQNVPNSGGGFLIPSNRPPVK